LQAVEKASTEESKNLELTITFARRDHPVTEESEQINLAVVTAEIVSAYVAHNQIATPDLVTLVGAVAGELRKVGTGAERSAETEPEPAVPVRGSIRSDYLVCLVCGKRQKLLKRHLEVEHGLTPREYRDTFELKPDYPMVAPSYTKQRRELALKSGLGQPRRTAGPGNP
jgi:predicted transcriptional regulator